MGALLQGGITWQFQVLSRPLYPIFILTLRGEVRGVAVTLLDKDEALPPLPLWETMSALAGTVCYLCEIILSHGTQPHLHPRPKLKELGSNLPVLHSLHFLTSRNVQHLALSLPSKPEQAQALTDPASRPPLPNIPNTTHCPTPTSLLWSKTNYNQMRISTCASELPDRRRKGQL